MTDRALVIAHRGYSEIAPENTLPAFQAAARAGADLIELDYRHSADGVPVVIHDSTLDRTTDADLKSGGETTAIEAWAWDRLQRLDAGSWFAPLYADVGLPSLDTALGVIQEGSVALIERKAGDARTLVDLLSKADLTSDVVVQSFDWEFLKQVGELNSEITLAALGPPSRFGGNPVRPPERRLSRRFLDAIVKMGCDVVAWNRELDKAMVDAAHKRGLKVWAYTINRGSVSVELLSIGVDGVITDNPARIWKAIALSGLEGQ